MRKIPTVFVRDHEGDRKVDLERVTPGCEWVFREDVRITIKWDGTCMMLDARGDWWHRRTVRDGKRWPDSFILAERDPVTGKSFGWVPVSHPETIRGPFDEALRSLHPDDSCEGTYELIGPSINGNRHKTESHVLQRHGDVTIARFVTLELTPLALAGLVRRRGGEGVVVYSERSPLRMAKLKVSDLPAQVAA